MTILSKLKNEYEESIKHLMNAALSLNKIINLGKRLNFILANTKKEIRKLEAFENNNDVLENILKVLEDYIEQLELHLLNLIDDEILDVDIWLEEGINLASIFRKDMEE